MSTTDDRCPICKGQGVEWDPRVMGNVVPCLKCNGSGRIAKQPSPKFDVYLTAQQCEALLAQPDGTDASTRRSIRGAKRAIRKAMAHPISYEDQRRYEWGAS